MLSIANHADPNGGNAFPSISTLADESRLSDRQTQRAIRHLQKIGELSVEEGAGRKGTHLFTLVGMGDNLSPGGVTNRTTGGDKSYKNRVRNVTQTFLEPSLTVQEEGEATPLLSGIAKTRSPDPAETMTKIWNEECSFSPARKPNASRRASCLRRWREDFGGDVNQWRTYCARIAVAPHLRGENDRGWRADLDWVLKPENLAHIMEGRFDPRAPPKNGNGKHPGTYRPGPGAALMEGAYNAAEEYIAKHGLVEAGVEPDRTIAQPLLGL